MPAVTQVISPVSAVRQEPAVSSLKSQRPKIVVVGGGMAGFALCDRLVRGNCIEDFDLTVFGDEPRPAYDRVNLSKVFDGRTASDLLLAGRDWYHDHDIRLRTGCRIEQIDRDAKQVIDLSGQGYPYDRLILATGSSAWMPPIPGADSDGVFVYRTLDDLERIKRFVGERKACVGAVLGGGLLGLEAAKVLRDLGLRTDVIEMAPGLMPRQLDAAAAATLKERVESLGVGVKLIRRTKSIQSASGSICLEFDNAGPLRVDILIVAAGVRPNDQLGRQCGLEIGPRGGFVVDGTLTTSDPDIAAIGECASFRGHVFGLVAPCYRMADILASRLAGSDERFDGADESAELKLLGVQVAALGRTIGESASGINITQQDETGYRELLLEQGRIVGAACVGDWEVLPQVRQAINRQARLWPTQRTRFRRTGSPWTPGGPLPVFDWPDDSVVCSCLGIRKQELCQLIESGIDDPDTLAQRSGASTACGSCRSLVCELAGASGESSNVFGATAILVASLMALAAIVAIVLVPPLPYAESVQSLWRNVDLLWRSDVARQITGYTLLGLTLAGLIFSLRKRWERFRFGSYGFWRATHGVLGASVLLAMAVHTGMSLGANLNFVLACVFLGTALLGSGAGILSSMESKAVGTRAMLVRKWRPRIARFHAWLFWPLPALIALHIFSFYWFSD